MTQLHHAEVLAGFEQKLVCALSRVLEYSHSNARTRESSTLDSREIGDSRLGSAWAVLYMEGVDSCTRKIAISAFLALRSLELLHEGGVTKILQSRVYCY